VNKPKILMIDDDPVFIEGYESLLSNEYQIQGAPDIPTGLQLMEKTDPDILLLDIALNTEKEGLAVLPDIKKRFPNLPIVIVTNWDSHLIFKEAISLGAADFFVKSDNINSLKIIIENLMVRDKRDEQDIIEPPIAQSSAFRQVLAETKKVAHSHCTVMITGETGVGKEIVAKYIHNQSQRRNGPFIPVNCGSIPETLIQSELFGHEKGAFTGALERKKGKFESANGGTLLLDELEELPMPSQPVLLRVLQDQEVERIGSTQKIPLDVRIIVATQTDLKKLVEEGQFREDLFYRVAVYPIQIPPLRDREDDVIPLCQHFLRYFEQKHQSRKKHLMQNTMIMLKNYHWPGNVRELQNAIEKAVISSEGSEIRPVDFQLHDPRQEPINVPYETAKSGAIKTFQRDYLKHALYRNQGIISKAAKEIGISRQALTKMIKDLHLDVKASLGS